MDRTQTRQTLIPGVNAAEVFDWHARPGAMARLAPAALVRIISPTAAGLEIGARARLRVGPGPGLGWTAGHTSRSGPDEGASPYGFVDQQLRGPFASWTHHHQFIDHPDSCVVREEVTWALPLPLRAGTARVQKAVDQMLAYRSRQLRDDLGWTARHAGAPPLTVAVSGASGLVGRQLTAFLSAQGHRVLRLVRGGVVGAGSIAWSPEGDWIDVEALREVDVVVHLAGEPIGKRFTAAHKKRILASRTRSTAVMARALASLAGDGRDRALVCASAMGWYGADTGDQVLTEDLPAGEGLLADVCQAWESAADPARVAGVRTVHVRTGIVQSTAGGQLALQLPLFRAGLGGPLGSGRQWMSWICLDDLVELYALAVVTPELSGPVNAVAPHPVRDEEYAQTLARLLHRPHALRVPRLGPEVLLGSDGARELALANNRMSASLALEWGHQFRHPTLASALAHELCTDV